jgi:hypothetical protein
VVFVKLGPYQQLHLPPPTWRKKPPKETTMTAKDDIVLYSSRGTKTEDWAAVEVVVEEQERCFPYFGSRRYCLYLYIT